MDTIEGGEDPATAAELVRIQAAYERRANAPARAVGSVGLFDVDVLQRVQGMERALLASLRRSGLTDLHDRQVLDVGCGTGMMLRRFIDYGAQPPNLHGIDLLSHRITAAKQSHPGIDWKVGSAHRLPYGDGTMDIVFASVLFTSVLDASLRDAIAAQMVRVLRGGGLILIYDFTLDNPKNPDVRGISRRELRVLFDRPERPGAQFTFERLTLAPPLARRVWPRFPVLAAVLEALHVLDTHVLATVRLP